MSGLDGWVGRGVRPKDIQGQRFGRLVAVQYAYSKNKAAYWEFKCDCGQTAVTCATGVRRSTRSAKSCGCLQREKVKARTTHSGSHDKLYAIWSAMRQRCNNPRNCNYQNYGARGISVCSEWLSNYAAFKAWALGSGYVDGFTIERRDNDGDYDPGNCKWATYAEQNRNRRPYNKLYRTGMSLRNACLSQTLRKLGHTYKEIAEIVNGTYHQVRYSCHIMGRV